MGWELKCMLCQRPVAEGSQVILKGKAPSTKEWRQIFLRGVEGLSEHFRVVCEDCQRSLKGKIG